MRIIFAVPMMVIAAVANANNSTVTINDLSSGYQPSYFVSKSLPTPETHVIGVYETRSDHGFGFHPEGTAFVHVSGTASVPVNLVLSSYEPTQWVLDGAGLPFIKSVLINGYSNSRVTGIDASKVINKSGVGNYLSACAYAWPDNNGGCNTSGLVAGVESHFGATIATFSGIYRATDFSIVLAPRPQPVNPALSSIDYVPNSGDNWITRDSLSGLDWLDVPLTAGQTFDQVRTGIWYQRGFRHATKEELEGLFLHAGTPNDGFDPSVTHPEETLALAKLLGSTAVSGMNLTVAGFTGTDFFGNQVTLQNYPVGQSFSAVLGKINYLELGSALYGEAHFTGGHPFSNQADASYGSFLVRAVPKPETPPTPTVTPTPTTPPTPTAVPMPGRASPTATRERSPRSIKRPIPRRGFWWRSR